MASTSLRQAAAQPAAVPAGFGARAIAQCIDWVAFLALGLTLGAVVGETGIPVILYVAVMSLLGFWAIAGTTPGKRVMKLAIVTTEGTPPTFRTRLLRIFGYYISSMAFGLGFLWVAWDREKQGWHDKIAGTRVVKSR